MKKIVSLILVVIMLLANVVYAIEYETEEVIYNGAPVVYVDSIEELPQSMLNNIMENNNNPTMNDRKISKLREYTNYLSNGHNNRNSGISPRAIVYPSVHGLYQNPQSTDYFCGYACLQSILEYYSINKSQYTIANEAYTEDEPLPWFAGSESQALNEDYYPAVVYLNYIQDEHTYQVFNSYFEDSSDPLNVSNFLDKVMYDVDEGVGIMVCGRSKGNNSDGSKLPNYPSVNIRHWILLDGYTWDIDEQEATHISFIDPAKSDCVTWSDNITAYSEAEPQTIYKYAFGTGGSGIIW